MIDELNDALIEEVIEDVLLSEVLDASQRARRKASMRRAMPKIIRARKLAMKRKPSRDKLYKRAINRARRVMFQRLAKKNKDEMSYAERKQVEQRLSKKKGAIERLAKTLMRKSGNSASK